MTEIHEGVCGTHVNEHMMSRQILRSGYYWTMMELDCINVHTIVSLRTGSN